MRRVQGETVTRRVSESDEEVAEPTPGAIEREANRIRARGLVRSFQSVSQLYKVAAFRFRFAGERLRKAVEEGARVDAERRARGEYTVTRPAPKL